MSKLYPLRPHQKTMFDMLKQSFKKGLTRPLVYAATGWGKTVLAAHIIEGALNKGKRICFVAPYITLINQTARSLIAQGIPQMGILQGDHPDYNPDLRLQIASVQTLARRTVKPFDLYIVDECDLLYTYIRDLIEQTNTPVIGLTATPYRKGLGNYYNTLLSSITVEQLMAQGYLCDYKAWAPCEPDMKGVRTNSKGEYQEKGAERAMSTPEITGSITDTWLELGNSEPTLCFAVNVAHANHIGSEFDKIGVTNMVITANTSSDDREEAYQAFSMRKITILISVMVLVAGFDKAVFNLILARPIKSDRVFMQIVGRGFRVNDGKLHLRIFDHGGNFERLGYPEDIHMDHLDMGDAKEVNSVPKTKEKEEKKPKKCPKCTFLKDAGVHECPECGFTPRRTEDVQVLEGKLTQIKGKKTKQDKQQIYSELLGYQTDQLFKGKVINDGWVSHTYKDMTGVWPNGLLKEGCEPSESTLGYIKHKQIKYAKSKRKKTA